MASTFRRRRPPPPTTTDGTATISTSLFKGTRAWTAGTTLVSTGLRELDNILAATTTTSAHYSGGGGQPIGSCLYLELDRTVVCGAAGAAAAAADGSLGHALIRYWCAETLSQEQVLLIPTAALCDKCTPSEEDALVSSFSSWRSDEGESSLVVSSDQLSNCGSNFVPDLLSALPRNLHKDKEVQQQQAETVQTAAQLDTLAEEEEEEENDAEEGLVVAWQYRKDVQEERLGLSNQLQQTSPSSSKRSSGSSSSSSSAAAAIYCHSYDLQGRLSDQMNVQQHVVTAELLGCCSCCCNHRRRCGFKYLKRLVEQLQSLIQLHPRKVVRVLFSHQQVKPLAAALPLFLNYIRRYRLPVVVLVVVQPWIVDDTSSSSAACLRNLQRCADVVLETESFVARRAASYPPPPEFRHLHGLLKVRKAATCTLATAAGHFANLTVQKRPTAALYGLKRDRRKLHVSLLHIPPEDYAAHGSSVGSTAVRSGAGRSSLTTTSTSTAVGGCASGGGNSPLDF